MYKSYLISILLVLFFSQDTSAQVKTEILSQHATIEDCIAYAKKHNPVIEQSLIDEDITGRTIRSKLADWYPQLNFNYSLQHNFQVQTSIIGGNPVRLGVDNTSLGQFALSQSVFNRDVLLAFKSKGDVQLQSKQTTASKKIDLAVNVSKAFYDVLATAQQIRVVDNNITRLQRSLDDAYNQFKAGVTDKVDYKRATISLNNLKATRKINEESLNAKTAYLKYLMSYPDSSVLDIAYDSLKIEQEIYFDTLQKPAYTSRIEYNILATQKKLLEANYKYEKQSYLPSIAVNGAYNLNFLNNDFGKLYSRNYPNSFAALTLAFPIYQGGKRKEKIGIAGLQLKRIDKDIETLQNLVNNQYASALASYKSNYANYLALKENIQLATEVYNVVQLQYRSGIKTYLEVIVSETDLRGAQINYFNALYQVLSSKIDLQRSLGQISAN